MNKLESGFERFLWSTRYVVILAVLSALVGMFLLFALATMDIAKLAWDFIQLTVFGVEYPNFHVVAVAKIITAVDEFLLATVLLIFAMGMYELFISDIDIAKDNKTSGNILMISSLDELKDRLGKVILMILVVVLLQERTECHLRQPVEYPLHGWRHLTGFPGPVLQPQEALTGFQPRGSNMGCGTLQLAG